MPSPSTALALLLATPAHASPWHDDQPVPLRAAVSTAGLPYTLPSSEVVIGDRRVRVNVEAELDLDVVAEPALTSGLVWRDDDADGAFEVGVGATGHAVRVEASVRLRVHLDVLDGAGTLLHGATFVSTPIEVSRRVVAEADDALPGGFAPAVAVDAPFAVEFPVVGPLPPYVPLGLGGRIVVDLLAVSDALALVEPGGAVELPVGGLAIGLAPAAPAGAVPVTLRWEGRADVAVAVVIDPLALDDAHEPGVVPIAVAPEGSLPLLSHTLELAAEAEVAHPVPWERPLAPVDLGAVEVGASATVDVEIANDGDAPLLRRVAVDGPAGIEVLPEELEIAPGAVGTVAVTFAPAAAGQVAAELVLTGHDPWSAERRVRMVGLGLPLPSGPGEGEPQACGCAHGSGGGALAALLGLVALVATGAARRS